MGGELNEMPNLEWDNNENIIGFGITFKPTPFEIVLNKKKLYTWCAIDTLLFPILLKKNALVRTRCQGTGEQIEIKVTPEKIKTITPRTTVFTIETQNETCKNLRENFCNKNHFFSSKENVRNKNNSIILSSDEAFQLEKSFREK